jgi:hypothetical protein
MGPLPGFSRDNTSSNQAAEIQKNSSSFETLNDDELEAHLGVFRYGAFDLTDAVEGGSPARIPP